MTLPEWPERIENRALDAVHGRIADLKRMERMLAELVARCAAGTVSECPILDALFEAGG